MDRATSRKRSRTSPIGRKAGKTKAHSRSRNVLQKPRNSSGNKGNGRSTLNSPSNNARGNSRSGNNLNKRSGRSSPTSNNNRSSSVLSGPSNSSALNRPSHSNTSSSVLSGPSNRNNSGQSKLGNKRNLSNNGNPNARSSRREPGSNSGDGCSRAAAGKDTIAGSKIAPNGGHRTIAPGRSAEAMAAITSLRTVSVSLLAAGTSSACTRAQ